MKNINRTKLINYYLSKYTNPSYLEIGVATGYNFLKISSADKIAVDPHFKIPGGIINVPGVKYIETTSDDYFKTIRRKKKFDVVFVDGLHTYPQSLKDVLNALKHLNKKGVIVMHDCIPVNEAASQRSNEVAKTMPGFNNCWNGDVWKTIVWLRAFRDDLHVYTVNKDFGLGVITFGKPENPLNYSDKQIEDMTYDYFDDNYKKLMNLKPEEYCAPHFENHIS